jgi:hypothetical protein
VGGEPVRKGILDRGLVAARYRLLHARRRRATAERILLELNG